MIHLFVEGIERMLIENDRCELLYRIRCVGIVSGDHKVRASMGDPDLFQGNGESGHLLRHHIGEVPVLQRKVPGVVRGRDFCVLVHVMYPFFWFAIRCAPLCVR